jgi:hypothetical protein
MHNIPLHVEPSTQYNFFIDTARISSRDEYRNMLCYGVFTSAAITALETTTATILSVTSPTPIPSSTPRFERINQWP